MTDYRVKRGERLKKYGRDASFSLLSRMVEGSRTGSSDDFPGRDAEGDA